MGSLSGWEFERKRARARIFRYSDAKEESAVGVVGVVTMLEGIE
jgi:hypothetical protein